MVTGNTGYRHQLDRARRFLERLDTAANEIEFQDMIWAFFQNCWHVKDWMKHDPLVPELTKESVIARAHQSVALMACRQLCNGTKHLGAEPGARHEHIELESDLLGNSVMDCMVDNGAGRLISGRALAVICMGEWVAILQSHGLVTTRSN